MEKIWYLKKINIFANLSHNDFEFLADNSIEKTYNKGEVIYSPVDDQEYIYILKTGAVKLYRIDGNGKDLISAILKPGELFGKLFQVDKKIDEFAETMDETLICIVKKDIFFSFVNKKPSVVLKLNKLLGLKVYELELLINDLVFKPVLIRLVNLILNLSNKFGEQEGDVSIIKLRLTHKDIASMIGATRETTTLSINKLKDLNLIDIKNQRIYIKDSGKLSSYAKSVI